MMLIGLLRKDTTVKDHFGTCRPVTTPEPEEVSHFVRGDSCKRDGTVFEETLDGIKELERQGTFMKDYFSKTNCDVTKKEKDSSANRLESIGRQFPEGTGDIFGTTNVNRKVTHATASPSRAVFGKSASVARRKSPKRAVLPALFSGPSDNGPSMSMPHPTRAQLPKTPESDIIGIRNDLYSYFRPKSASIKENLVSDLARKSVDRGDLETFGKTEGTLLDFIRGKRVHK